MPEFTVLLVEDDCAYRQLVADLLRGLFPRLAVAQAGDAAAALLQVRARCPDLVFLDLNLGPDNGLDLIRRLHLLYPAMPMAILRGRVQVEYRQVARALGVRWLIDKAGYRTIERIAAVVERVMRGPDDPRMPSLPATKDRDRGVG